MTSATNISSPTELFKERAADDESGVHVESSAGRRTATLWRRLTNTGPANDTKRAMQSRHLMMLAIGGTIGTGIFLSAGSAIALAGPGSALLSYVVVGLFVYTVVISLGEMAAMYPVSGAFSVFGSRFVSPALGFTLGWNYWFQWALSIPSELTAAAIILEFWAPQIQPWQWALIIIVPIFPLQLIHVRVYGESEYWFALIKVLMIVIFILVGLIYDWGGINGHPGPGLSNFHNSQAFVGGFSNFAQTFVYAFYSFGGVELVAVAAGESDRPYKSVPRAIKATFFRIVLFYILAILTIGLCINWKDPTLLTSAYNSDVTASPITVVFQRAGFGAAVHIVNAVLLTAVLSATNSAFYGSSRMLLSLARSGQAPKVFGWVSKRGVPIPALLISLGVACLTFLTTIWGEGVVFTWLLNLTGISALLVWGSIGVISLRFRAAYHAQGRSLADLPYVQPLFPVLPVGVVLLAVLMFIAEGYAAVKEQPFSPRNVVAAYIGVALYLVLYVGYIVYERFILGKREHIIPLLKVDLDTDAVWQRGEGLQVRQRDMLERKAREEDKSERPRWKVWLVSAGRYIY
ncbi:amino acid permease-domain-containing protein [Pisolithus orientalis]|uniref:amino acid permease-domain-containing protein n=1 Tax=Pisolithus orientalis TaxID=936130 RepID=UPI002225918C|nr:amino acid permease-domain-containing protein [Pisolithus orientalis]KAI5999785.1 amino acid permease-domain-containing protein [Pisolithus orientalis]